LFGALDAWVRAVLNALVATVSLAFWPAQKQINPASGDLDRDLYHPGLKLGAIGP
jgi:hypothetical protein